MGATSKVWFQQMRAMTKKNLKLKTRRKCLTIFECCCPGFMTALGLLFLYFVKPEVLMDKVTWRSHENETFPAIDSKGTNFLWDPFPRTCLETPIPRDHAPENSEGDEVEDDDEWSTPFKDWMLNDRMIPQIFKSLSVSLLQDPRRDPVSKTFAVGPGKKDDFTTMGGLYKNYLDNRAKGKYDFFTTTVLSIDACFTDPLVGNSWEICVQNPKVCVMKCPDVINAATAACPNRRVLEEEKSFGRMQFHVRDNELAISDSVRGNGTRRLQIGGDCNKYTTPCECAKYADLGCGWSVYWSENRGARGQQTAEKQAKCTRRTRKSIPITSCFECPEQDGCTDADFWARFKTAVQNIKPSVTVVADASTFDEEMRKTNYPEDEKSQYCGAIMFQTESVNAIHESELAEYSVRLNNTLIGFQTRRKISITPRQLALTQYYWSDFLHLQRATDDFITCATHAEQFGCLNLDKFKVGLDTDTRLLSFPTPSHIRHEALDQIAKNLAENIYFGMTCTFTALAYHILKERELKIREGMKSMGAFDSVQYTENFLFNAVWVALISFVCALIIAETSGRAGFPETTTGSFFIVIWLAFLNGMALTSWFCSFFSNVFPGLLFVFVIVMVLRAMNIAIAEDNESSMNNFLGLFPATNLRMSIKCVAQFEKGQSSNNFNTVVDNFSLGMGVLMNLIGMVLWNFLYYYCDQVAPKEIGVQRAWYFPIQKSYWREVWGKKSPISSTENEVSVKESRPTVEKVSEVMRQKELNNECVEIKGLRKEFSTPGGQITAVNDVHMTMYSGEIFALLGHNGAGKTTLISILTGLVDATAGTVKMMGKTLEENLMFHRHTVGICPQFSVLWPLLTPREHLEIFSAFKGVAYKDCEEDMNQLLRQLGLYERRHQFSYRLSGGMQRKLSLAIAFTGNPSLVFLDEPSSGMDATARRDTWEILSSQKAGRIIVLTTHFMEEADVLGDRVCIMDHGEVRCNGSALFLKELYGCGYNISCLMDTSSDAVKRELKKTISKALNPHRVQILSQSGKEIMFLAPFESASNFSSMFLELDDRKATHVETYSVGVSNLEEVFLKVASGFEVKTSDQRLDVGDGSKDSDTGAICATANDMADVGGKGGPAGFKTQAYAQFYKHRLYAQRNKGTFFCRLFCPIGYTCLSLLLMFFQSRDEYSLLLTAENLNTLPGLSFPVARTSYSDNKEFIDASVQAAERAEFGGTASPGWVIDFTETCNGTAKIPFCTETSFNFEFQVVDCLSSDFQQTCLDSTNALNKNCTEGSFCVVQSGLAGLCVNEDKCNFAPEMAMFLQCQEFHVPFKKQYDSLRAMAYKLEGARSEEAVSRFGAVFHPPSNTANYSRYSSAANAQFLFVNLTSIHSPAIFMNQQTNILLQQKNKNARVRVRNYPFPYTAIEEQDRRLGAFFVSTINIMLGFGLVTSFALSYVVFERQMELKKQQFLSGTRIMPYWVSLYITDFLASAVTCISILVVLFAFDIVYLIDSRYDQLEFTIVILVVFSFSQVPFVYLISNWFSNANTALMASLFFNLILSPVLLFLIFMAELVLLAVPDEPIVWLNDMVFLLHWVMRCIPVFSMGDALLQTVFLSITFERSPPELKTEDKFETCIEDAKRGQAYLPSCSRDIWDQNGPMKNVTCMIVCAVAYPAIVLFCEFLHQSTLGQHFTKKWSQRQYKPMDEDGGMRDKDVLAEEHKVALLDRDSKKEKAICVTNLRKTFVLNDIPLYKFLNPINCVFHCSKMWSRTLIHAVQGVSFSADHGEVFGLLGVNGAGKSTTFNMLMGTLSPSPESHLMLAGSDDVIAARRHIGYCPQDNLLFPFMTCMEHLKFYGRIKGIPTSQLYEIASELLKVLNMTEQANKLAGTLSGGNKRKLCVAIALVGPPPLIFLDEPSTGVDPMARRFMWSVIQKLAAGNRHCTVILTTHSMEECEALCSRCAIMVNGVFRCIGPTQHLKKTYGLGFGCDIVFDELDSEQKAKIIEQWETTSVGQSAKPLAKVEWICYSTMVTFATELGRQSLLPELAGQNSPYPLAARVSELGTPLTKKEDQIMHESTIMLKNALEWWYVMAGTRQIVVELVQSIRAATGAPPLQKGPSSSVAPLVADTIGMDKAAVEVSLENNANKIAEADDIKEQQDAETETFRGFEHLDFSKDDVAKAYIQEVHGNKVVLRVETQKAVPLHQIFVTMEELKNKKVCGNYTVCHTSLERIFNTFAKEAVSNIQVVPRC